MSVTDLDAWRRVCMEAFRNLPTDTEVSMGEVDAVLLAGAREAAALDKSSPPGWNAQYEHLIGSVSRATGVDRSDVDAILTWCARDAVGLIEP